MLDLKKNPKDSERLPSTSQCIDSPTLRVANVTVPTLDLESANLLTPAGCSYSERRQLQHTPIDQKPLSTRRRRSDALSDRRVCYEFTDHLSTYLDSLKVEVSYLNQRLYSSRQHLEVLTLEQQELLDKYQTLQSPKHSRERVPYCANNCSIF